MQLSYLIRTDSLETDDRLQKTYRLLERAGIDTEVFAIVKIRSNGSIKSLQKVLLARRIFSRQGAHIIKYTELIVRASFYLLMNRSVRWYANFDFIPLHVFSALFSSRSRRPLWDLHEMPPNLFSSNRILRSLMGWLLRKSNVIVCNEARKSSLEEIFNVKLDDALVIRNYPDTHTIDRITRARDEHLSQVGQETDLRTIVIVGGDAPGRFVEESLAVVDSVRCNGIDLRVLIAGGIAPGVGRNYISSTGRIPFDELARILVKGGISLCFYDTSRLNNLLCEPNRFYQALASGQHIVTFAHPSLVGISYPLHHVIPQETFEISLRNTILDILSKGSVANFSNFAPRSGNSTISFESQFPKFKRWILDCYKDLHGLG